MIVPATFPTGVTKSLKILLKQKVLGKEIYWTKLYLRKWPDLKAWLAWNGYNCIMVSTKALVTRYLVPFSDPTFCPIARWRTENISKTVTIVKIFENVIKLRKFPTRSSLRLLLLHSRRYIKEGVKQIMTNYNLFTHEPFKKPAQLVLWVRKQLSLEFHWGFFWGLLADSWETLGRLLKDSWKTLRRFKSFRA